MKTYVIYHGDCPDGFGVAWSFWKKFKDQATYYPMQHGMPVPEMEKGSRVYIADFSFKRDILLQMQKDHKELVLLDHHKSAEKELEGLAFAKFDMNKSGAILTWEYLYPEKPIPLLLKYVEDRDLWLFKLPKSKEVHAYLTSVPMEFVAWDDLVLKTQNSFDEVVNTGEAILRYNDINVELLCKTARMVEFDGHKVPSVGSVLLSSELGHALLNKFPESPFSITWFVDKNGGIKLSFRSRGDFDVSELARKFGGGGHKAASGCPYNKIP